MDNLVVGEVTIFQKNEQIGRIYKQAANLEEEN